MKFAVDIPNFGHWSDPRVVAEFAATIEAAGWDGLTIWDHILVSDGAEVVDPWIALAAAAVTTERIMLMTSVTPIPRRTPWKLAREVVSLDHLCNGRFVLGVGIGWPTDPEFTRFAGPVDLKVRADMLDEGLDVLVGLWSGEPFAYEGEHYSLAESQFLPKPIQQPRVPIWVAGMWPNRRPLRRAARFEGAIPIFLDDAGEFTAPTPESIAAVAAYIGEHRSQAAPYDISVTAMNLTDAAQPSFDVAAFADAGASWWFEQWHPGEIGFERWLQLVEQGPPPA